ncbi:MAG: glycosyltransferase, partial [Longimicrobiales bacterium]
MDDFKRVTGSGPVLRVLHLHLLVGQQSEANQFLYPSRHQVGVVTFFPCGITFPDRIPLFEGDGTFWGFRRALRAAEEVGPWDIVHAHGPIDGMLYLLFCELTNRSLGRGVYSAHHSYTNTNFNKRNRLLSHGTFKFFDRVTCVSQASMDSFPPRFKRLAKGRLSVVSNGVDLNRLDETLSSAPPLESKPSGFQVASVGRLIDIKDPMTVLAAFGRIASSEAHLTFIGTGDLADPLD